MRAGQNKSQQDIRKQGQLSLGANQLQRDRQTIRQSDNQIYR